MTQIPTTLPVFDPFAAKEKMLKEREMRKKSEDEEIKN